MAKRSAIDFGEISSATVGDRLDLAVDLSGALEDSETITSQNVVSSDTDVLVVSLQAVNEAVITMENGDTIAIGKGVQFRVTVQKEAKRDITFTIPITGNSGTKLTIEAVIKVVDKLRSAR